MLQQSVVHFKHDIKAIINMLKIGSVHVGALRSSKIKMKLSKKEEVH